MSKKSEAQDAAIEIIKQSLNTYGSVEGLRIAREKYYDTPRTTWDRWLKKIDLDIKKAEILEVREAIKKLPSEILPMYVSERPAIAKRNIDFISRLEGIYADAEMLREFAMSQSVSEAGLVTEKVKIPVYFMQSIKLRADLLESGVKALQQLYDLKRTQQFYDSILAEITKESPELAHRIIERLDKLNTDLGVTIDARIV